MPADHDSVNNVSSTADSSYTDLSAARDDRTTTKTRWCGRGTQNVLQWPTRENRVSMIGLRLACKPRPTFQNPDPGGEEARAP